MRNWGSRLSRRTRDTLVEKLALRKLQANCSVSHKLTKGTKQIAAIFHAKQAISKATRRNLSLKYCIISKVSQFLHENV